MDEGPLLVDRLFAPLLVGAGVFGSIDGFVHLARESVCKFVQYHGVVNIEPCMAYGLFKLGDVSVQLFALHLESLAKHYLRFFLLQYICILPIKGSTGAFPKPFIGQGGSSAVDLKPHPCVIGLTQFLNAGSWI